MMLQSSTLAITPPPSSKIWITDEQTNNKNPFDSLFYFTLFDVNLYALKRKRQIKHCLDLLAQGQKYEAPSENQTQK